MYHITRLTAVVAVRDVGFKLAARGHAPTFTLMKTFFIMSLLMADECQRDAATCVPELVCANVVTADRDQCYDFMIIDHYVIEASPSYTL